VRSAVVIDQLSVSLGERQVAFAGHGRLESRTPDLVENFRLTTQNRRAANEKIPRPRHLQHHLCRAAGLFRKIDTRGDADLKNLPAQAANSEFVEPRLGFEFLVISPARE
jgi:hypothetical protein